MDEKMNHRIGSVLQVCMNASIIVIVIGLAMLILMPGDYEEITLPVMEIFSGILEGNPIAVIDLGMLMLIATPLIRVLALTFTFLEKKEMKFVLVCAIVLLLVAVTIIMKSGS